MGIRLKEEILMLQKESAMRLILSLRFLIIIFLFIILLFFFTLQKMFVPLHLNLIWAVAKGLECVNAQVLDSAT